MKIFATISAATAASMMFGATAMAEAPNAGPDDYLNDVRLGEQVDRICFRDQINDFREGTESTIIVERGAKDYLIQTDKPCNEGEVAPCFSQTTARRQSPSTMPFRADAASPPMIASQPPRTLLAAQATRPISAVSKPSTNGMKMR